RREVVAIGAQAVQPDDAPLRVGSGVAFDGFQQCRHASPLHPGGPTRTRTWHQGVMRPLLQPLSYGPAEPALCRAGAAARRTRFRSVRGASTRAMAAMNALADRTHPEAYSFDCPSQADVVVRTDMPSEITRLLHRHRQGDRDAFDRM